MLIMIWNISSIEVNTTLVGESHLMLLENIYFYWYEQWINFNNQD